MKGAMEDMNIWTDINMIMIMNEADVIAFKVSTI